MGLEVAEWSCLRVIEGTIHIVAWRLRCGWFFRLWMGCEYERRVSDKIKLPVIPMLGTE